MILSRIFFLLKMHFMNTSHKPHFQKMSGELEEQADELLALSTIVDASAFSHTGSNPNRGSLEVQVGLKIFMSMSQCCVAQVRLDSPITVVGTSLPESFRVQHLPPLKMEFSLPSDYPSTSAPTFCLSCPWLTLVQKSRVEQKMDLLWVENRPGVILFLWLDFLQEELINFLELQGTLDISGFEEKPPDEAKPISLENLKIIDDDEVSEKNLNVTEKNEIKELEIEKEEDTGDSGFETSTSLSSASSLASPQASSGRVSGKRIDHQTHTGLDKVVESRVRGKVVSYRTFERRGLVETWRGPAAVFAWDIIKGDIASVEASLAEGEEVEVDLVAWEGQKVSGKDVGLQAVRVTGVGGKPVRGSKMVERGRVLVEKEVGQVVRWSTREGDGMLKGSKGEVYCWGGSVQEEGGRLNRGDLVTFTILDTSKWGILAAWVSREDVSSLDVFPGRTDQRLNEQERTRLLGISVVSKDATDGVTDRVGRKEGHSIENNVNRRTSNSLQGELSDGMKQAEVEEVKREGGRRRRRSMRAATRLSTLLREFNNMKVEEEFSVTLFTCEVCFSDRIGSQCLKFVGCDHVYCRDCMSAYFTEKISSGAVSSLICPTTGCDVQALPTQVSELVQASLYSRYEQQLLETELESMADVVTCPRVDCQCPTMIDRETNLGQCPACSFAFCIYCKATYHGVSPCKFKTKEQRGILDQYAKASHEEKLFMERRYGKKQLTTMSANLASEDYLADKAKMCPHCNAPIEKNEGCNKITCWRCSTNFCWLCGIKLAASNPYHHFNTGGPCFGALFQGVDPMQDPEFDDFDDFEDDDWDEIPVHLL